MTNRPTSSRPSEPPDPYDHGGHHLIGGGFVDLAGGRGLIKAMETGISPNDLASLVQDYKARFKVGRPYQGSIGHNVETAKRIGEEYQNMKHDPTNPRVKASYDALAREINQQHDFLKEKGFKFYPWRSEGQPYADSKDMRNQVLASKVIKFFPTHNGFGSGDDKPTGNPLENPSGRLADDGSPMLTNDVLRAVHDVLGHAVHGHEFGPRGEERAWHAHASMFSEPAIPALTTETRGQNSWVNFGKHLQRPDGSIPKKGEEGWVHPTERPYADQKTGLMAPWTSHESSVTPPKVEAPDHPIVVKNS